jgi:trans-aconitate methyltransferase
MGFFDNQKNVDEYLKLAEGYDGRDLIDILKKYLHASSTVLELGMGPGKDLDMLSETYKVTGSDNSNVFLDMYREKNPTADLLNLDAVTLKTSRKFDCIYSNKVLHHLERSDLCLSFEQQYKRLEEKGLLMHSFWLGTTEEEHQGLRFVYYMEDELIKMAEHRFTIIETNRYKEMEPDDSFYIIMQKSK